MIVSSRTNGFPQNRCGPAYPRRPSGRRPLDAPQQGLKLGPALRLYLANPGYGPFEVCAKVVAVVAVLARRTKPHAVVEYGAEPVEVRPANRRTLVDDNAGHFLPLASAHEARLSVLHVEALVQRDGSDQNGKAGARPREGFVPREDRSAGHAPSGTVTNDLWGSPGEAKDCTRQHRCRLGVAPLHDADGTSGTGLRSRFPRARPRRVYEPLRRGRRSSGRCVASSRRAAACPPGCEARRGGYSGVVARTK